MKKRQLRLNGSNQIKTHLAQLVGKKINIVLADNSVVFGELKKIKPASISIVNLRFKELDIPMNHVYEIYLDIDA